MNKTYISPEIKAVKMPELMQTLTTSTPPNGGASGGRAKQFDIVTDEDDDEQEAQMAGQEVKVSDYIKLRASLWED